MEKNEELPQCVRVLSDVLHILHGRDVGQTKDDVSDLMLSILRTVIQTVINTSRADPLIGNLVAVMIEILRQMTPYHYNHYINYFATRTDLLDFLMEILLVFQDLVREGVYAQDCTDMIFMQNQVILSALRHFAKSIRERFFEPFEYQLWSNFFHCSIAFLTQASLQLENFSPSKRARILSKYKDMRRETAVEVRLMWYHLGQHKIQFVPDMVGPFLEMTLIPEAELRRATIPIFFDMMQCEFYSPKMVSSSNIFGERVAVNPLDIKGEFKKFEKEMISKLDNLVEGGRGDDEFKDILYEQLGSLCENHSDMSEQGLLLVSIIVRLMKRLLEYRQVTSGGQHGSAEENKDNTMACIVQLLEFYHEIDRKEMYIRYLYKLTDLHLECENYTEAANTLQLHARLLNWSDEPLPTPLKNDKYEDCDTHRQLKERLYLDIIDYFDKGKLWEEGLRVCKDLVVQYQTEIFDYMQLSILLHRMSVFYDNIMKQCRPEPEYFRVGYYGLGFPTFIQNKTFVYRGKSFEKLFDFQGRLLNQFPNAQLLTTLKVPGAEVTKSQGQYLLINKVDPVMQKREEFKGKLLSEQILKYYKVNDVFTFVFSKPIRKSPSGTTNRESDNEFTNLWVERTTLTTSYPFPGILRWYPVTQTKTFEISPIENAIETIDTINQELKSLILQHMHDNSMPLQPLSLRLNGIVDAAVNGGISNYEKSFFAEHYGVEHCTRKDHEHIARLKEVIACQIPILDLGINIHKQRVTSDMLPLHEHMEMQFQKLKKSVEEKYGRRHLPDELSQSSMSKHKRALMLATNAQAEREARQSSDMKSTDDKSFNKHVSIASPTSPSVTPGKTGSGAGRSMSVWVRSSASASNTALISNSFTNTLSKLRKQTSKDNFNVEKTSSRKSKENNDSNAQWYISESAETNGKSGGRTQNSSSPAQPIPLSQPLTSHRPLRSEYEKRQSSRPGSYLKAGSTSPNRTSTGTSSLSLASTDNCIDGEPGEEPPPLPAKGFANAEILTGSSMSLDQSQNGNDWTILSRGRKNSMERTLTQSRISKKPLPPLPSDPNSPEPSRRHSSADSDTKSETRIPPEIIPRKPFRAPPEIPPIDYENVNAPLEPVRESFASNNSIVPNNSYEEAEH